jgi:hypothetical protein
MSEVEKKCALSRRLWVVTVDTSMFKISKGKGARNGEKRLTVGVQMLQTLAHGGGSKRTLGEDQAHGLA